MKPPRSLEGVAAPEAEGDISEAGGDISEEEGPMVGAVIKVRNAGELSAVLDFVRPRVPAHRVQLIKFGVGSINQLDLAVASAALDQKLPTAVYAFNLPAARADVRAEARRIGVPLRRFELLHELLADLLERAGLPGPQRELARMADDAPEATGYSRATRPADPRTAKDQPTPSADGA